MNVLDRKLSLWTKAIVRPELPNMISGLLVSNILLLHSESKGVLAGYYVENFGFSTMNGNHIEDIIFYYDTTISNDHYGRTF